MVYTLLTLREKVYFYTSIKNKACRVKTNNIAYNCNKLFVIFI